MNKLILISALVFFCFCSKAQNLVPNNGFDTYTTCPSASSQFSYTPPWSTIGNVPGSPDYMNACFDGGGQGVPDNFYGFQEAVSDSGYYGLITFFGGSEVREYLTVPLTSPLSAGSTYTIGFHVSLSDNFRYASDHFGAYFSTGAVSGFGSADALPFDPHIDNAAGNLITDATGWTLITGTYTAVGGEDYLTIGNFHDDDNTLVQNVNPASSLDWAYYYVDEVFVTPNSIQIIGDNSICLGDSVTLHAVGDSIYSWANDLNPSVILSTDSFLTVMPLVSSTYSVYGSEDTVSFTVNVIPPPIFDLGNDTTLCEGELLILDVTTQNATYDWQDNSMNPIYSVSQPGSYWAEVSIGNCSASDSIFVNYNALPIFDLGNDTILCPGETLILDATSQNATYNWQDNSTNAIYSVTQQGTYWAAVSSDNCTSIDSIQVNYYPETILELGNDTTLCEGEILTLDATTQNATYVWQDNSTNPVFDVTEQGTYWTEVMLNECGTSDTIQVNYNPLPIIDLGIDSILCQGEILTLDATTQNATYVWQDNSTNSTYEVSQQGLYWAQVEVSNCTSSDSIFIIEQDCSIILDLPNVFTPNDDGMNDVFTPIYMQGIVSMHTIIYNRWGNNIFETSHPEINWNGQDANDGTYFWLITYSDFLGEEQSLKGHVTLLRK